MRTWITQLRKGLLEFCILNAISGRETYGYELVQRLEGVEQLAVTESTVYPILSRLRQDGYVRVRDAPSTSGPPRRYFSLTSIGRHRVAEMNAYWDGLCEAIVEFRNNIDKGHSYENR
jgi:PadR family transcriptional regulator, regulatory protein PadR